VSRVLVTGASGFTGRRATAQLAERGHEVHAISRSPGPAIAGVTWHDADLLDPTAATSVVEAVGASHLLHLAWYAVPGRFWTAPENEQWVPATERLFEAFAGAGGERAVMAGTCAEYRWDGQRLDERSSTIEPATRYGQCKDTARRASAQLAEARGVSLAWGRIFFLYGPHEHPDRLVASVARGLLRGERVATSEGSQVRDFMHVDDVASAFVTLVEGDVQGPVNVASGQPTTVRDVITLVAEAAGGLDRVDFGALPMRAAEPARIVGAADRLHNEAGFRPRVGLAAGLTATVEWWREQVGRERPPDEVGSHPRGHGG
jgi:nucleoside-diphosphate-sugar epimerase